METRMLKIYAGGHRGTAALRLQGQCCNGTDAAYLQEAMQQVLTETPGTQVWIDCEQLESLTWQGQRALLNADQLARTKGVVVYWCGIPAVVRDKLAESGLLSLLQIAATTAYRGVLTLLEPTNRPSLGSFGM
ncbi:STAS domain-containing protein [Hymenobacter weizhouensis]|uniref:STAS domain-containing protein n=1 Tax=Hymenobacter sp. YIM 151500-1 TaxID=2987689 RepID=UPI0022275530|nr:STAS domain-containing protein [Hymenobacter sp. YIM 151500-1]UYZ64728.1 STAS domain-containing protein [Hymenobacter sp. YIM 151500-1]